MAKDKAKDLKVDTKPITPETKVQTPTSPEKTEQKDITDKPVSDSEIQATEPKVPEVPAIQAEPAAPAKVVVALNYPHDVIFSVPDSRGIRREIVLKGNAAHLKGMPMGILPVGTYGLTEIDAGAWDYIKKQYAGLPIIKNGLAFASAKNFGYAVSAAAERKTERNGFEPIDPNKTATSPANGIDV